jgi:hypothetical protein
VLLGFPSRLGSCLLSLSFGAKPRFSFPGGLGPGLFGRSLGPEACFGLASNLRSCFLGFAFGPKSGFFRLAGDPGLRLRFASHLRRGRLAGDPGLRFRCFKTCPRMFFPGVADGLLFPGAATCAGLFLFRRPRGPRLFLLRLAFGARPGLLHFAEFFLGNHSHRNRAKFFAQVSYADLFPDPFFFRFILLHGQPSRTARVSRFLAKVTLRGLRKFAIRR